MLVKKKTYDSFGLKVDMPRSEGAGISTTGNVCHKAFSNPALLSEVLDIDKSLIIRFQHSYYNLNATTLMILLSLQTIATKLTKFSSILMVIGMKLLLKFTTSLHMVLITF